MGYILYLLHIECMSGATTHRPLSVFILIDLEGSHAEPTYYSCTENPVLVRTAVRYRDSDSATTVQDSQYSCTYCTLHGTPPNLLK